MLGDAIGLAIRSFEASKAESRVLILLSDGTDTGSRMAPGRPPTSRAQNGVVIHTIAVGDPEPPPTPTAVDIATLQAIAGAAGGTFHRAEDATTLAAIYARIDALGTRRMARRPPGARARRSPRCRPPPSPRLVRSAISSASPASACVTRPEGQPGMSRGSPPSPSCARRCSSRCCRSAASGCCCAAAWRPTCAGVPQIAPHLLAALTIGRDVRSRLRRPTC